MWLTKAHTSQEAPTSTSGSSSPEHAKSLKKCSDKISDKMLKKMYKGFSEEEIDKFEEYLHRIIKNFEEKRKVIDDGKSISEIIDRRL